MGALIVIVIAIIAVILLVAIAFLGVYVSNYNRAIRLEQAAEEAWGNVETNLQRRFDLVDNLVATVKGYAAQEKEIFTSIAEARTRYFQADRAGSIDGQSRPPINSVASCLASCCSRKPIPNSKPARTSAISRSPSRAQRTASRWRGPATTRRPGN